MSITTEDLVTSLLSIGYNKVDAQLFIEARKMISNSKVFKFIDSSINKVCNNFISFDGNSFRLNKELSSNMILNRNTELTNYLITNGLEIVSSQVSDKPKTRALIINSN